MPIWWNACWSLPLTPAGNAPASRLRRGAARCLYGLAWRLARPVLRRHKRLSEGFAWRLVPENWSGVKATENGRPESRIDVWIQAASGGEAYLAWELLKRLADGAPLSALVTTRTRQGLEVLHGMAEKLRQDHPELSVRVTFFPLDQPGIMARALDQARPRAIALLETELWPGLLLGAADRGIPVFVLNGRMTEKSLRNYLRLERLCPGFWRGVAPRAATAVSNDDAARLAALFGPDRVVTVPNIKFDRCLPAESARGAAVGQATGQTGPAGSPDLADLANKASAPALPLPERGSRPLILLASVREEEEEAVMTIIRRLRRPSGKKSGGKSGENSGGEAPTLAIAPRHMHRVAAWKERLAGLEGGYVQRSRLGTPSREGEAKRGAPGDVILWDAFGELALLYAAADAVFVGGSLAPLGGQNFLEALAAGRIPCCGPYLDNFAWALSPAPDGAAGDALAERGLLLVRRTPEEVAETLIEQARHPLPPEETQRRFLDWLTPRLGGAARCAALLHEAIRDPSEGDAPCEK